MPRLDEALQYVTKSSTGVDELRRACRLLELPDDGDVDSLRSRLSGHLSHLEVGRPVICLNPGPVPSGAAPKGPRLARPRPDEHSPVFTDEIALVPDVDDFARMLEQQLDETRALSLTFGEAHADMRYAQGKWTVRDSIGHLADCERLLAYRLLRALRRDETPLHGFDQTAYVAAGRFERRTLADLVAELSAVRASTVWLVRSALDQAFDFRLHVGKGTITGRAVAYLIAGHERHHQQLLRTRYLPCLPAMTSTGGTIAGAV